MPDALDALLAKNPSAGTPSSGDALDALMRKEKPAPPPGPSTSESFFHGLAKPFVGIAELGARAGMVPAGEFGMGSPMPPPTPSETLGAAQNFREGYEAKRKAAGQTGTDWAEIGGSVLGDLLVTAPLSVLGPEAVAPTMMGRMGQAAKLGGAAGAITGATEPTSGKNFLAEKPLQIAAGAGVGAALGVPISGLESVVAHFLVPSAERIEQQASDVVVRRLTQDAKAGGPSAEDALKEVAEWQKTGKPMTLSDVGGENTKGLAGYVGRQPGESRAVTRQFLTDRDRGAGDRLSKDVSQYISDSPSAYQTTQALLKARSQAARPLYGQAEALQNIWSPRLQQFLDEPDVKRGLARGFHLERLDSLAENRPFDPTQMGVDLDAEGNVVIKRVPNLRVLDMGKRGLDAMIADERDPITGRLTAFGRSLENVRGAYVSELDGLDTSGVYKAARSAWAGPSKSLDATKFGRTIFNRNPEETAAELARMEEGDREFVRLGVADVLRERIAKTGFGGNEARALIKNAWTQQQLRPLFKSGEDFDKFVDAVMAEHTMAETTSKVMRGSQTAERLAEDQSADTKAMSSLARLAHGVASMRPGTVIREALELRRMLGLRQNEPLNEGIAKLLFTTQPALRPPPAPSVPTSAYVAPTVGAVGGDAASSAMGLR